MAAAQHFPANRFKALDYVFEETTRLKVIMNLLALPEPYFTGTSNSYPHDGKLSEDVYRTPWTRGKVFSSCKLFISGSVLEDLGDRTQVNSPERFDISLTEKSDGAEVIPSSNGESLKDLEQNEYICLVKGSQINFCQDSFLKWTPEQIHPDDKNKDFLLPEDLMIIDYLPQFKRHLPTLQAKLSRLRTLPVSDPLRSTDDTDSTFRNMESYEIPPDLKLRGVQTSGNIHENFEKESPAMEESLLLPTVVDTVDLSQRYFTTFSSLCGLMSVVPEQLGDQPPVLGVLHEAVTASVEISQYEILEESVKWKIRTTEAEMAGHAVLPTELDLDLTLSPETRLNQISLSTHKLQKEELSLHCRPTLLSAKTQTEMEAGLWNAEKHPASVVGFLLAEPQMCKTDGYFGSLSEVFKVLKLEGQSLTIPSEEMQVFLCNSSDFTEKLRSEVPSVMHGSAEEFQKLPLQDFKEVTEMICLKKQGSAAFHAEGTADENCLQRGTFANTFQTPAANTPKFSENQIFTKPAVKTIDMVSDMSTPGIETRSKGSTVQRDQTLGQGASSRLNIHDSHRGVGVKRCPPEAILDPLSSFMVLRAEQAVPVEAAQENDNTSASQPNQQTPELQPSPGQTRKSGKRLTYTIGAVSENVTREQESACQPTEDLSSPHVHQSVSQYRRDVQATDSQKHAYWELLAFAEPFLKSARQLGLNLPVRGDFSCLDPDQTHFLLKQQEKAVCRTHAQSKALVGDQEVLFNLAALINALVMFKELLLNCSLSVALEYLTHTAETCAQQNVQHLLKRLQIILFLSNKNSETNFRLLELQHQLSTWLHSREGQATKDRVLVLISVDNSRSIIITSLSHVTGGAVTAVSPEEGMKKLNGASLVSHMQASVCVVVCEEHVGPDFPWNCFSLVVEYDHPGQSPWATICKEKGISHFTFNTVVSGAEEGKFLWCLEDNVPYVLLVTEGLLSCPQLLQTLESSFNITVVERRHSPALQMLGGIHHYAVLTVDESTCIVIQEEDELCRERASEVIVMRLSALSLQYSCCWLILHCPHSHGGGLPSPAFSNLVLCYSALELFKNQKLEDLNVKVLIACEVTDVAKWISRICFLTLMSTDVDPLGFLDRDWLSVIPSEDENRLLLFPCINPLVGQLMLKRAPVFQWLLGASLPQLQELLPEVPQKVLKLFSDTTSLFISPSDPEQSHTYGHEENIPTIPRHSFWTDGPGPVLTDFQTQPEPVIIPHPELFCTDQSSRLLFGDDKTDFRLDLSSFLGGSGDALQRNWTSSDPWKEKYRCRSGDSRSGWSGRAGVLGGVVQRAQAKSDSPFRLDFALSCSPVGQQSVKLSTSVCPTVCFSDSQHIGSSLTPPPNFMLWNPSRNLTSSTASANYGTKCCIGQERKRSGDAAVLTPLKKGRLCYERVPGRSDGQTRLKLF